VSTIKSSLASCQLKQSSPEELFAMKKEGWLNEKILVISPEDASRLNAIEQQVIEKIGSKLYGRVINGR
jgi:hypothetical protein